MIYRTSWCRRTDDDFISAERFSVVGYPVDDLVRRDPKRRWSDLIDPEDRERVKAVMLERPRRLDRRDRVARRGTRSGAAPSNGRRFVQAGAMVA